jgi:predicted ribonuclease YlaK
MDRYEHMNNTLWVMDTSILMSRPHVMTEIPGTYILPEPVLRELANFQMSSNLEVSKTSKALVSFLIQLMDFTGKTLLEGIDWTSRSDPFFRHIRIVTLPDEFLFPKWLDPSNSDDQVIATALFVTGERNGGFQLHNPFMGLVTEDDAMKLWAKAFGVPLVDPYIYYANDSRKVLCFQESMRRRSLAGGLDLTQSDERRNSPTTGFLPDHHDKGNRLEGLH